MAEKMKSGGEQQAVVVKRDWTKLLPKAVGRDDEMAKAGVDRTWAKIYRAAGMRTPSEDEQAACRLAVYVYCAINGTSRHGSYAGSVQMSNGHEFPASVIPIATGLYDIRRFFRGNMEESYIAMKESEAVQKDTRFVANVAKLGVPASCVFACADWLTDCPAFTPEEQRAHEASLQYRLSRSRRARGGKSIETVERETLEGSLRAQGPVFEDNDPGF